jgi:hypothetical protein|tara:strand:+ start:1190 stop:1483 length:294 start_codon:yes stop_codon:yes gene_type:complete
MQTAAPEKVNVNLIEIIASIERAGKCFEETQGRVDIQALLVEDNDLAAVYLGAADKAKELFEAGQHPELSRYDKRLFDVGYDALKSGEIVVTTQPSE